MENQEMEMQAQAEPQPAAQQSQLDQLEQLKQQAEKLREMQADLEREEDTIKEDKEDVDGRSVYVGNVDYSATVQELEKHFRSCGNINRVNIMVDKFGNSKAYAYIEFAEPSIVTAALLRNETEFKGRMLKVLPKRTNLPGFQRGRGGRGRGGRGRFRGGYRGRRGGYNPY